jgi:hypothetical protein
MRGTTRAEATVAKIEALDTGLFAILPAHTGDRISLLRIQRLMRRMYPNYAYLEIGSDTGASLLPHLLDPLCRTAISIDSRPESTPDERAIDFHYFSTARMMGELGKHASPADLAKLSTIESDASAIDLAQLRIRPQLVFIDAEHTNPAAFSDFMAVLPVIAKDSLVTFHDANLIGDTLRIIERLLTYQRRPYRMLILPECVGVFAFGEFLEAVEIELAPHAMPRAAYFVNSKRYLQYAVADAVVQSTDGLRGQSIADLVAWTAAVEQKLGAAGVAATDLRLQQGDGPKSRVLNDDAVRAASMPVAIVAHLSDLGDKCEEHGSIDYTHKSNRSFEIQGLSISSKARALEYKIQYQDGHWTDWVEEGTFVGNRGKSEFLRGIAVRVKSDLESRYSVRTSCRFAGVRGFIDALEGKEITSQIAHPLRAVQVDLTMRP